MVLETYSYGYLDKVNVSDVVRFETEALNEVRSNHGDLLEAIANEKELSKELVEKHIAVATFHSMMLNHVRQHVVGTGLVSTNYETTHMLSVLKKHGIPAHHLDDFRQFSRICRLPALKA